MDRRRVETIYREYVVAPGLERAALLEALRERFSERPTMLYPGSSVHVTPSFFFEHVVYVDRSPLAHDFFANEEGVRAVIDGGKRYRGASFVRFIEADFTRPLPVPEESFDVLLALYAGGISRACTRYVRPGGLVLTNDHHGDAREAAALPELSLEAVVEERRVDVRFIEGDLGGYLHDETPRRSPRGEAPTKTRGRAADYYLFRKRFPARS